MTSSPGPTPAAATAMCSASGAAVARQGMLGADEMRELALERRHLRRDEPVIPAKRPQRAPRRGPSSPPACRRRFTIGQPYLQRLVDDRMPPENCQLLTHARALLKLLNLELWNSGTLELWNFPTPTPSFFHPPTGAACARRADARAS